MSQKASEKMHIILQNDKPLKLVGDLKGFIVIENKCYYLTAESEFEKDI